MIFHVFHCTMTGETRGPSARKGVRFVTRDNCTFGLGSCSEEEEEEEEEEEGPNMRGSTGEICAKKHDRAPMSKQTQSEDESILTGKK